MRTSSKKAEGKSRSGCPARVVVYDLENDPTTATARDPIVMAWWRTFPADEFGSNARRRLGEVLDRISATNPVWQLALRGDAAAAVCIALQTRRDETITSRTDLLMTALMRCALEGSAGAALILSHSLRQLPLENRNDARLGVSWLAYNLNTVLPQQSRRRASKKVASRTGVAAGGGRVIVEADYANIRGMS
jgi:hypothetical protein